MLSSVCVTQEVIGGLEADFTGLSTRWSLLIYLSLHDTTLNNNCSQKIN